MVLVLKSLRVPSALAVETATAYRVFTVWLPLIFGYLFARHLPVFKGSGLTRPGTTSATQPSARSRRRPGRSIERARG